MTTEYPLAEQYGTSPVSLTALEAPSGLAKVASKVTYIEKKTYPGGSKLPSTGLAHKEPTCGMVPGSWPEIQALVEAEFGVGHIMVSVARAESRFAPSVWNCGSSAQGVFQILVGTFNDPHYGCTGNRLIAEDNIACARKILDKSGTRPWSSSGPW